MFCNYLNFVFYKLGKFKNIISERMFEGFEYVGRLFKEIYFINLFIEKYIVNYFGE